MTILYIATVSKKPSFLEVSSVVLFMKGSWENAHVVYTILSGIEKSKTKTSMSKKMKNTVERR